MLAERLWLELPEVTADVADQTRHISNRRKFEFKEVHLEPVDGNVRPDVMLVTGNGSRLHVEIFVRHRVDPAKIDKLKARNISSVEIVLSDLDWDDRSSWEDAVLWKAHRRWLHNRVAAAEEQRLTDEIAAAEKTRAAQLQSELDRLQNIIAAPFEEPTAALIEQHDLALRRGFASLVVPSPAGANCFRVKPEFWQTCILNQFLWDDLAGVPRVFETNKAFAHVQRLVRSKLGRISRKATLAMQRLEPSFATPWHAVHGYLKWLKVHAEMFDPNVRGMQWLPSHKAVSWRNLVIKRWRDEQELKDELLEWVNPIMARLPADERCDFDRERWAEGLIASYDRDQIRYQCRQIANMVGKGIGLVADSMGLPLEKEYQRQLEAQTLKRALEEQAASMARKSADRAARIDQLRVLATGTLGSDAQTWLEEKNAQLEGATPMEIAATSDEDLSRARNLLQEISREIQRQSEIASHAFKHQETKRIALEILTDLAKQRATDPIRADLWCNSANPKLSGARPSDFCVDESTLTICKRIMPQKL